MTAIAPLLIVVVGVLVLGGGVLSLLYHRARLARSLRAEGVVTGLVGARPNRQAFVATQTGSGVRLEPKVLYRPQIRFTTGGGRTVEVVSRLASRPARYQVGDRVTVVYDPQDPSQVDPNPLNPVNNPLETLSLLTKKPLDIRTLVLYTSPTPATRPWLLHASRTFPT